MGGSQKSKRITWAPDVNLCQVRLFSSAKPPSEVGMGNRADDSLPPGFEDMKPTILKLPQKAFTTQKAFTKWRCPPRFEVDREWQVVSGEESKEIKSQNQRVRRVLEAIYPRPSAIPPNPRLPVNAQESISDDHSIPLIPLNPIEEADHELASSVSQAANSSPMIPQPNGVPSSQSIPHANGISMQLDIAEAAQAALAAVSNKDQTNLIDRDLLIRILSNPTVLQQLLITSHATQEVPSCISTQPKNSSNLTYSAMNGGGASLSAQTTKPEPYVPHTTIAAQPQLRTGFVSTASCPPVADVSSAPSPCMVKDMNYYKSLIQQHGGSGVVGGGGVPTQTKRVMGASQEFAKSRDNVLKSRMMKPCMYFNSPRGCRNGANCAYQHDIDMFSSRKRVGCLPEVVGAKRVKLGR